MTLALLLTFATLFTPARMQNAPNVLLIGNFLSCPDNDDSSYGERIFPYVVRGTTLFALHLGPADELALFAGPEADIHEDHNTRANLLFPAYHVGLEARRVWSIASLHVSVAVVRGGGSDPACESFFVTLTQHPVTLAAR
jgi:hypothetical protein